MTGFPIFFSQSGTVAAAVEYAYHWGSKGERGVGSGSMKYWAIFSLIVVWGWFFIVLTIS